MAAEETVMGIVEDKVIKNHYAAEYLYNKYKNEKTFGVIERDEAFGLVKIAEPVGVVAAVVPTTNPTSTAIFKTLISLKTRNGIIIYPHPRAKKSTIAAAKIVLNPVDNPTKQAAFAQYKYPNAKERYAQIADFLGLSGSTDQSNR